MNKIIVCSDSHGAKYNIEKIFNNYSFDYFIFLGDGLQDLGLYEDMQNVIAVRGNCDFFSVNEYEKIINLYGKKFLITHGNNYNVKLGLGALTKRAKELNVDIVLFGHTHKICAEIIEGIYFINPGSLKNGSVIELTIGKDIKYKAITI